MITFDKVEENGCAVVEAEGNGEKWKTRGKLECNAGAFKICI